MKDYAATEVLVVVPTNVLKLQWEEQTSAKVVCIHTAVKMTDQKYSLLVLDECHLMLSKVFRKAFDIQHDALMCLTGTTPSSPEYAHLLEQLAPIRYVRTMEEAVEDGAISDCKVFNVAIALDKETRSKYDTWNRLHSEAKYNLIDLNREYDLGRNLFEIAKTHKDQAASPANKAAKQF